MRNVQDQEYRLALARYADRVRRGCASEFQEPVPAQYGIGQDEAVQVRREVVGSHVSREVSFCE
jgi:hypothetical protein